MGNVEQARFNMVEQQIRPWDVTEERILELMQALPREKFVPEGYMEVAYTDTDIPLVGHHCMMQPKVVARALQALNIQPTESVLEIGTGTGYTTVLLAQLSNQLVSVEIEPQLHNKAKQLVNSYVKNVTLVLGDAALGWEQHGPYDAIFVTGSYPLDIPTPVLEQLNVGGRCFAVTGQGFAMKATLFTKTQAGINKEVLFETSVPALTNAPEPPRFSF